MLKIFPKFFGHLTIKQKMLFGFGFTLLVLVISGLMSILAAQQTKIMAKDLINFKQPMIVQALEFAGDMEKSISGLGLYQLTRDKQYRESSDRSLRHAARRLAKLKQKFITHNKSEISLTIVKLEKSIAEFKIHHKVISALATQDIKNFPAMELAVQSLNPRSMRTLSNIKAMIDEELAESVPRHKLLMALLRIRYEWSRVMNGVRGYLGFKAASSKDEMLNYLTLFTKSLHKINTNYKDKLLFMQEELIAKIIVDTKNFSTEKEVMFTLHEGIKWRKDSYLFRIKLQPLLHTIQKHISILVKRLRNQSTNSGNSLITQQHSSLIIILGMLAAAIAVVLVLAYALNIQIIKPMREAVKNGLARFKKLSLSISDESTNKFSAADDTGSIDSIDQSFILMADVLEDSIAQQQKDIHTLQSKTLNILDTLNTIAGGNLAVDIEVNGSDTIDDVAYGIKHMVESLSEVVREIQTSSDKVTSSTLSMASMSREHASTVTEQAASTQQVVAATTQISHTNKELAATMSDVSHIADITAQSANDSQEALSNMETTMEHMKEATESIGSKLQVLSEKANNINAVATTINKVADQTNLLSLNAAIEAEKAGEYGRGFAVVATEIRRLADQTAVATWDIERMIKEIQSAVSAGVMSMDKFSEEVTSGVTEVGAASTQLGNIISQVQELQPMFDKVNHGMKTQSVAADQINDSMIHLNEAAHHTADSLKGTKHELDQLSTAADAQRLIALKFRLKNQ